jgi:hypothetical protein
VRFFAAGFFAVFFTDFFFAAALAMSIPSLSGLSSNQFEHRDDEQSNLMC